jgi:hypothetical protein
MLALNERTWRWADRFVFASRRELLEEVATAAQVQSGPHCPTTSTTTAAAANAMRGGRRL